MTVNFGDEFLKPTRTYVTTNTVNKEEWDSGSLEYGKLTNHEVHMNADINSRKVSELTVGELKQIIRTIVSESQPYVPIQPIPVYPYPSPSYPNTVYCDSFRYPNETC